MDEQGTFQNIATKSLRACYVEGKVVASPTHFSDFWARDTFWALQGMLKIGDIQQAKKCLEYFLSFQRADGKIPRKISRDINVFKYLFGHTIKRARPRPTYHGLIKPFYAKDTELLFVIAFCAYIKETDDKDFFKEHHAQVEKALAWHIERTQEGLIGEYFLGNWMDTVLKFGPVLYTNVLYAEALRRFSEVMQSLQDSVKAEKYKKLFVITHSVLQKKFWNGEFFADEARLKSRETFDLAGNVLAVHFDIADDEQKEKVVAQLKKYYEVYGTFLPAVPTGQKWWKINPVVRLMGIADYHTQTSWLWVDALVADVLQKTGDATVAQEMYTDIARVVERDGEVGETYFQSGKSYKKRLWKSASPFAWSSGVILSIEHETHNT